MKTLDEYQKKTIKWAKDRKIIPNATPQSQMLKLTSEIGELADNLFKGNDIKDDVGDCLVVLTIIAELSGTDLQECWEYAWNDIKNRRGFLNKNGAFIKDTDPNYEELLAKES